MSPVRRGEKRALGRSSPVSYKQPMQTRPGRAPRRRGARLLIFVLVAAGLAAGGFAGAYALASTIRRAGSQWTGSTIVKLQSHPAPIIQAPPRAQAPPDHLANRVKVPLLVGVRYDVAAAKLRSLRFGVRRTSVSSTRPAGIVVTVTPA